MLSSQVPGDIVNADEDMDDELDMEVDDGANSLGDLLEWGSETATTPPSENDYDSDPATPSLDESDLSESESKRPCQERKV